MDDREDDAERERDKVRVSTQCRLQPGEEVVAVPRGGQHPGHDDCSHNRSDGYEKGQPVASNLAALGPQRAPALILPSKRARILAHQRIGASIS